MVYSPSSDPSIASACANVRETMSLPLSCLPVLTSLPSVRSNLTPVAEKLTPLLAFRTTDTCEREETVSFSAGVVEIIAGTCVS